MNISPQPIRLLARGVRDPDALEQAQRVTQVSACVQLAGTIEHRVGRPDNRQRFRCRVRQWTRACRHIDQPRHRRSRAEVHDRGRCNKANTAGDPPPCAPSRAQGWFVGHSPCGNALALQRQVEPGSLELLHASEQHQRLIAGSPLIDSARQQVTRPFHFAGAVRVEATVQKLFGLALTLCNRLACAFDVGARTIVIAVQKDDTRPDVDRLLVVTGEIVIQT